MDSSTLVKEQIEAGNRFLREFEKTTRVVVGYWLKDGEDGNWSLCVASDRFNSGKHGTAFADVLRIAQQLKDPNFEPFQVNLIGLNEGIVKAAIEFYTTHSPKIPFHLKQQNLGDTEVEEAYLIKGPTGEYTMPSGREVLDQIIDREASFFQEQGKPPRKIKLPILMAYDLAKCGRNELGELSGRVFKDGITAFEKEGFHGMTVEIVRDRDAKLEFE